MATFTQLELKTAQAATADTTDAPRACGFIVKGGKRFLLFPHVSGNISAVKERTAAQIAKFWARLGGLVGYEIVPNSQYISDCNGNIYAQFIAHKYGGFITSLCVADYNDYKNELSEG